MRAALAIAAFLAGEVLVDCAWARATFRDAPGAIRCTPTNCGGQCTGGVCEPFEDNENQHGFGRGRGPSDAGPDA